MAIWKVIETEADVKEVLSGKDIGPFLILKHSPRCSLSFMAKSRLERSRYDHLNYYLLDVVNNRAASNFLAAETSIPHESPQMFVFEGKNLLFTTSHSGVSAEAIDEALS